MGLKILIASPDRSLCDQISHKLREAYFSPLVATSAAEAAFIIQGEKCTIAILDCQLPDPGPDYLAENLRAYSKEIRIIFIHSETNGAESIKLNQARDIYLPFPFFMPDLLEVINLWGVEKKSSTDHTLEPDNTQEIPTSLAWLLDVNKAAQYLTRLSLEIDAQVALIIRDARIWAYAGQLSKIATEELAQFVGYHWANSDGSDLARFVRLETTGREYMLYATHLGSGFVLTLCFMSEMPFSKIRAQTGELARKLTDSHLEFTTNFAREHDQKEKVTTVDETKGGDDQRMLSIEDEPEIISNGFQVSNDVNHLETQQFVFDEQFSNLELPDANSASNLTAQITNSDQKASAEMPSIDNESSKQKAPILPENKVGQLDNLEKAYIQETDPIIKNSVQLKSGSFDQHDLSYSCVLIPRLPGHDLTGGVAELIKKEMTRLCLAYGWRLEQLNIRTKFLHWVVGVTPDVSASTVIQHIREQTSAVLFDEYPRFEKENPSGDFWAPGFLVIGGRQLLTGSMVRNFIQNTRSRQGVGSEENRENYA